MEDRKEIVDRLRKIGYMKVEPDRIRPSQFCLRDLDEAVVEDIGKSIETSGLLQPLVVRLSGQEYELVAGLHRLEACKRLGWKEIPVIVWQVSDEEAFLMSVVENLQRNIHINPIAEAQGYRLLINRGWTIVEIAEKIGKSCSYVCDRLRVLSRLHPKIRKQLRFPRGKQSLTISHAEHLSLINDKKQQLKMAKLVEKKGLSVHQLERWMKKFQRLEGKMPEGCLCRTCPRFPCEHIR